MIRDRNKLIGLGLIILFFVFVLITGYVSVSAENGSYEIVRWVFGSGSESVRGGEYSLNILIGEPISGNSGGGVYSVESGLSSYLGNPQTPTPAPEMDVLGNSQSIVNGDSTPSLSDHTDFGTGFLGSSPVTRTFTIENTGGELLNLTSNPDFVQVAGTHAADFTVTGQPSSPVAAGGGTSTFTISFSPSAIGLREAQIIIANDDNDENPYTFSIQGTGSDGTFSDVTSAHWAFKYIEAIADAGLTSGYPDGTYRPENRVTRAEMAVFLLNALGISPGPLPVDPSFSDIELHWAETFIEELADQGITGGYPDGTYRPENRVTRAEMAVFLLNALGISPGPLPVDSSFSDIEGHWAEIFIEELADQGITGGYPDGTYRPENRVTRAEMAVFLVNTFGIPLP